jgi:RNA polymerase sigma-70 factor, ECF subfamily
MARFGVELSRPHTETAGAGHGSLVAAGPDEAMAEPPPANARREQPVFDELYDAHFDFVWRNLRRLGVLEPNLWDGAQDVFLVVHRRLADFEPGGELRSWLYSIVVRVARQHRRSARRKPSHAVPDQEQLVDAKGIGPERSAAQSQELRQLMSLLERLDDAKREAFVLAELEGLSAPEIARVLDVNVNTLYARIRAARRELEAELTRLRQEREA